jgi:hypothetical protein
VIRGHVILKLVHAEQGLGEMVSAAHLALPVEIRIEVYWCDRYFSSLLNGCP